MEFSTDRIIDLALNVAAYVAAGALWMVMYSLFERRGRIVSEDSATGAPAKTSVTPAVVEPMLSTPAAKPGKVQFIGFGKKTTGDPHRRNRAEVLRLAREMIRDGATDGDIKSALPVSDVELAVLDYERK